MILMNNSMRLQREFFENATAVKLSRALIGCQLAHEIGTQLLVGTIIETEAYNERDEASHAFNGTRTKRNDVMFMAGGHLYVYFIYGKYNCMNIVAGRENYGSAVLIRAIWPTLGIETMRRNRMIAHADGVRGIADGPGKLCQALAIDRAYNGIDITDPQSPLYILPRTGERLSIMRTPRIGISKATEKRWRFVSRNP